MSARRRSPQRAFTLIELLVVVSIIALLIAILLPSLQAARKQAKTVICMTNMRSLSTATVTYVAEWLVYPASLSNFRVSLLPTGPAGQDWLGIGDQFGPFAGGDAKDPQTGNPMGFTASPRFGTLWPYIKNEKAFLCPEDIPGPVDLNAITGGGGNGKFSYTMFDTLGLRAPERIVARMQDVGGGARGSTGPQKRKTKRAEARTPVFVEEHPWGINGGHREGNFNTGVDFVVSRHGQEIKRAGIRRGTNEPSSFGQRATNIAFADAHVESVKVNFGFGSAHTAITGDSYAGIPNAIPFSAEGLLHYYGIDNSDIIEINN